MYKVHNIAYRVHTGKDPGLLSCFEEAVSCLSSPSLQLVELHKERHWKSLNYISIEQTDITIADSAESGESRPSKWRSIAVEGTQENIVKFLETKVRESDGEGRSRGEWLRQVGGDPQGYAQFVMDLSQVSKPGSFEGTQPHDQCTVTSN